MVLGSLPPAADGTNALVSATAWVQQLLLGTVGTTLAIVAVASVGLLMLSGRVTLRRGAAVLLGCFILFGAPTIVAGLRSFGSETQQEVMTIVALPPPPEPPSVANQAPVYDPYAGAAVPVR